MKLKLKSIFGSEQSSGVILIICVIFSLLIANSSAGELFAELLAHPFGFESLHLQYSLATWINDGLMAVFFLLVGLEIKREILEGELSDIKKASLPIFAAIGGMLVPALIYFAINHDTEYHAGWGIPMATDIAFSLAILSLLGKRVPISLKVFLAALAIVDDLGAILVIAIFYTTSLHWLYLGYCLAIVVLLIILNLKKVSQPIFYIIPGLLLWYFMHHSGIHATIAGVILAFCIPNKTNRGSLLKRIEHSLHKPVSYFIMPVFAFANTNIMIDPQVFNNFFNPLSYGIMGGLIFGKFIGISLFSYIAIKLQLSSLPERSNWNSIFGVALLAGIGFTMSIFLAILSFPGHVDYQNEAKVAILLASLISGVAGFFLLKVNLDKAKNN